MLEYQKATRRHETKATFFIFSLMIFLVFAAGYGSGPFSALAALTPWVVNFFLFGWKRILGGVCFAFSGQREARPNGPKDYIKALKSLSNNNPDVQSILVNFGGFIPAKAVLKYKDGTKEEIEDKYAQALFSLYLGPRSKWTVMSHNAFEVIDPAPASAHDLMQGRLLLEGNIPKPVEPTWLERLTNRFPKGYV